MIPASDTWYVLTPRDRIDLDEHRGYTSFCSFVGVRPFKVVTGVTRRPFFGRLEYELTIRTFNNSEKRFKIKLADWKRYVIKHEDYYHSGDYTFNINHEQLTSLTHPALYERCLENGRVFNLTIEEQTSSMITFSVDDITMGVPRDEFDKIFVRVKMYTVDPDIVKHIPRGSFSYHRMTSDRDSLQVGRSYIVMGPVGQVHRVNLYRRFPNWQEMYSQFKGEPFWMTQMSRITGSSDIIATFTQKAANGNTKSYKCRVPQDSCEAFGIVTELPTCQWDETTEINLSVTKLENSPTIVKASTDKTPAVTMNIFNEKDRLWAIKQLQNMVIKDADV